MDYVLASPPPPHNLSRLFHNELNNSPKVLLLSADSRWSLENRHSTGPKLVDT